MIPAGHFVHLTVNNSNISVEGYVTKINESEKVYYIIDLDASSSLRGRTIILLEKQVETIVDKGKAPADLRKWTPGHVAGYLRNELSEYEHVLLSVVKHAVTPDKYRQTEGALKKYHNMVENLEVSIGNGKSEANLKGAVGLCLSSRAALQNTRVLPFQRRLKRQTTKRLMQKLKRRNNNSKFSGKPSSATYFFGSRKYDYDLRPRDVPRLKAKPSASEVKHSGGPTVDISQVKKMVEKMKNEKKTTYDDLYNSDGEIKQEKKKAAEIPF